MDHTRDNCISVRCVPSSGAPRQLPPGEARVVFVPASVLFATLLSSPVPAVRSAFPWGKVARRVPRSAGTDEGLSPCRADCFPPGKPGQRSSLRRCGEGHPEKQTTIAKQIQSRQADVQHPLVPRRTFFPFASAPPAPGVQGYAPAALFPRFLSRKRNRAAGGSGEKDHLVKADGAAQGFCLLPRWGTKRRLSPLLPHMVE